MQTDRSETLKYNLSVLKRRDSAISQVLDMAGHVVMYRFNEDKQSWDRKNVEGSLFVVQRDSAPQHQFVVLNRLSSENLVENINEDFQMELTEQFLLYRNALQEINGIWFYSATERAAMAELLQNLSPSAADSAQPAADSAQPAADSSSMAQPTLATTATPAVEPAAMVQDEPLVSPGGTSSNVAQFFNMMQNQLPTQDVPPMPGVPVVPGPTEPPLPKTATPAQPAPPPAASPAPAPPPQVHLRAAVASQVHELD